ncbi:MAG: hypothetical protein Salg2KO_08580 [Salibacteraceae bacterium]
MFCLGSYIAQAQERVTTFGLQFKPLLSSNLLGTGIVQTSGDTIDFDVDQRMGYAFGGVVRKGITQWLSVESGINFVRRNYEARSFHPSNGNFDTTRFRIIAYEIPISGLVFVRLSEEIYMDASFGLSFNMFPSDVSSVSMDQDLFQRSFRNSWVKQASFMPWLNVGLTANVGFEYRTRNAGYFYFGGSYLLPFKPSYNTFLVHERSGIRDEAFVRLSGNYLTLDFKYFFHEEPEEREIPQEELPAWMRK